MRLCTWTRSQKISDLFISMDAYLCPMFLFVQSVYLLTVDYDDVTVRLRHTQVLYAYSIIFCRKLKFLVFLQGLFLRSHGSMNQFCSRRREALRIFNAVRRLRKPTKRTSFGVIRFVRWLKVEWCWCTCSETRQNHDEYLSKKYSFPFKLKATFPLGHRPYYTKLKRY